MSIAFLRPAASRPAAAAPPPATAPAPKPYVSNAKWAKPLPRQPKANYVPAQSFLHYNWLDKDPELDFVKAAIADSGLTLEQIEVETEKHGHKVSKYTLLAWCYGDTRRPQNVTMQSVMAAIGWDRPWKRRGG